MHTASNMFYTFFTSMGLKTVDKIIVKSGSFLFVKVMWTVEKQTIQAVNSSSIQILNFGRSQLVFLFSGWAEPFPVCTGTGHITTP